MRTTFLSGWLVLIFLLVGCSGPSTVAPADPAVPRVRVRLLEQVDRVTLEASSSPTMSLGGVSAIKTLKLPERSSVNLSLNGGRWMIGNASIEGDSVTLTPNPAGSLQINGKAYRGQFHFVPVSPGKFDVVNEVDIEGYLKGVLARELYRNWNDETYKAQAIVARTYALYERATSPQGRHWDVFADTRSQVYGGMEAETDRARKAVDETAGIVVVQGPPGREKIFKAYFSACCGGISQSAADAFGDAPSQALSSWSDQGLCRAAPNYNWGPISIPRAEFTRRVKGWGERRDNGVKNLRQIADITAQTNKLGRPTLFYLTDVSGTRFMLRAEEFRNAVNFDAGENGKKLLSSFVRVVVDDNDVQFLEGHGHGHGVGLCQWGAQRRAEMGIAHEAIVMAYYPGTRLIKAYDVKSPLTAGK